MTLDSVKTFGEGGSLDTTFCAWMEMKLLKMKQFFIIWKIISFLSYKQMFDADVALDGNYIDFKVFQSSFSSFTFTQG